MSSLDQGKGAPKERNMATLWTWRPRAAVHILQSRWQLAWKGQHQGNRLVLYLVTLSVSIAFLSVGVQSAWPTVVLAKFKNNETRVDINKNETSVMLAMIPVGFSAGSLTTRFVADRFGRRAAILGSALPIFIGSVIATFALKAWLLYITEFIWNCGTGMLSTVIGIYIAEIADKDIRGTLSLMTAVAFKLGMLLAMCIGPFISYEALNCSLMALPLLYFLICYWIPESPYYCLKQGKLNEARKSLRKLRRYEDEMVLEGELLAMDTDVRKEMAPPSSAKELFTGKQYRKAIVIAAGLKTAQMLTGGVIMRQYLAWIVQDTKLSIQLSTTMIIYGAIAFVVGLMSSVLVDRVERRTLLIWSFLGTGVSLAVIGVYFFLQDVINVTNDTLLTISFVPLLGIIMSNTISTIGFSSLIFVIPAEIFPLNVKTVAMTSLNIFGAVLGFILALGYQKVKDYMGSSAVFWIFAAFGFGGALFSYSVVTETKGKKLGDIQMELQGDMYDPVAVDDEKVDVKDTEMQDLNNLKKDVS